MTKYKHAGLLLLALLLSLGIYNLVLQKNKALEALKEDVRLLEEALDKSSQTLGPVTEEAPPLDTAYIRGGNYKVNIYSNYEIDPLGGFVYTPAFGPLCQVNPFAIEATGGIKILNKEGQHLTRVVMEGLIPTWLLEKEISLPPDRFEPLYMYVKEDTPLMLSPDPKGLQANLFPKGKAVKIIDTFEDWYYVDAYLSYDSNTIYNGWMKKNALVYIDAFQSIKDVEVKIDQSDTPGWSESYPNGLWGRIYDETEHMYLITSYGASVHEVKKQDLAPLFTNPND